MQYFVNSVQIGEVRALIYAGISGKKARNLAICGSQLEIFNVSPCQFACLNRLFFGNSDMVSLYSDVLELISATE